MLYAFQYSNIIQFVLKLKFNKLNISAEKESSNQCIKNKFENIYSNATYAIRSTTSITNSNSTCEFTMNYKRTIAAFAANFFPLNTTLKPTTGSTEEKSHTNATYARGRFRTSTAWWSRSKLTARWKSRKAQCAPEKDLSQRNSNLKRTWSCTMSATFAWSCF